MTRLLARLSIFKTNKSKKNLKRFLSYAVKRKKLLIYSIITGIIRYVIPLAVPLVIKVLVDTYLIPAGTKLPIRIHMLMVGLIILYVIYAVVSYFRSYYVGTLGYRLIFDLQRKLYLHLQKMSLSYFDHHRIGEIVNRMTGDIHSAQNLVSSAVINTIMDIVYILAIITALFLMHPSLAAVSLVIFPFYIMLNRIMLGRMRAASHDIHQRAERISGELHEQFSAISTIQAFTQEEMRADEFVRQNRGYFGALRLNLKLQSFALGLTGFLTSLGPIIVLWAGAIEVYNGRLTVGGLMAFYAYVGLLYQPTQRLAELRLTITNGLVAIDRIFEIFDTYPEVCDNPSSVRLKNVEGDIAFSNVTFGYTGAKPIFSDFSLAIGRHNTIALVGHSGAGKSSLANLLLRFYDVSKGSITIDGIDIRGVTLQSLRSNITFVAQNPILLQGSIEENLRLGKPHASIDEIRQAAKRAFADQFIEQLPNGYGTEIGERGARLSAGERQRVAIARAFLKDAPILILDEPTSALDPESEDLFKKALKELVHSRTTIIIAHRLTTIEFATRIIVIMHGKIVEEGTHEELVNKKDGLYRKYLSYQSALRGLNE
ncbi:MAG: hypothetical protein A2Z72_06865 [Omnitrophica bacterium RBG_13_46_9]|nr:MAG: hypothetical protein A2Z72_06865 [Omnitrophica bacterium RBG_13_46_9]